MQTVDRGHASQSHEQLVGITGRDPSYLNSWPTTAMSYDGLAAQVEGRPGGQ